MIARSKCPTHELEQPCRSCRADRLADGTEHPTTRRTRTHTHEPEATPMPAWVRAQLTPKENA